MKVLLMSVGTRGDIEPFLALGELLEKKDHEIIYSFPEQFNTIIGKEARYHPLTKQVIELIESKDGRIVMGKASPLSKLTSLVRLYKKSLGVNRMLMQQQYEIIESENPDLIIHNVKCNYPFLWSLKHAKHTVLVSPVPFFMYYVEGHSHIGFNKDFGAYFNKLTYKLSNFGLAKTIHQAQKQVDSHRFRLSDIKKALHRTKLVYTISPTLFQRPDYWKEHVQVLGYHERDKMNDWSPDSALLQFLNRESRVLFVTFGSMVNSHPEENSRLIYALLDELGIPAVINTAAGGLLRIPDYADSRQLYFVDQIPYEWILSRVYAVIHHGGSGTTHLALKYACPSLIIPHIIDQFGWNSLIRELGAGPKGIAVNTLSAKRLKPLIQDLYQNRRYQHTVDKISKRMREEDFEESICEFIFSNGKTKNLNKN